MRVRERSKKKEERESRREGQTVSFWGKKQLPKPSVSPQGSLSLVLGAPLIWRKVASTGRGEREVASGLCHLNTHTPGTPATSSCQQVGLLLLAASQA